MRSIKLVNLEYKDFETIRDVIYTNVPFALINQGYSPKLKMGYFNFWDSDYIVDELKPYIMQPPLSRENKEKMSKELADVMVQIEKSKCKLQESGIVSKETVKKINNS